MVKWGGDDTEYGGILYRSRCEAGWAKFFDEHSIKHKYEPERVDLGIDSYTPDFYLKEFKLWVEIKAWRQYKAHSKCYRLALETRKNVLLIQGYTNGYIIDTFSPDARRAFVHRTVVSEGEAKPTKEDFVFAQPVVSDSHLTLMSRVNGEILKFPYDRRGS